MTETQRNKNETLVKEFLKKKEKASIKDSSKKVRKFLLIDWYVGNTAVKFETFKKIDGFVPFQGIGWFRRSRARWMALYVEEEKKLYLIEIPGVRRYVRETKGKMVDGYYKVDINILRSQKLIHKEFSLGTVKKLDKKDKKETDKKGKGKTEDENIENR